MLRVVKSHPLEEVIWVILGSIILTLGLQVPSEKVFRVGARRVRIPSEEVLGALGSVEVEHISQSTTRFGICVFEAHNICAITDGTRVWGHCSGRQTAATTGNNLQTTSANPGDEAVGQDRLATPSHEALWSQKSSQCSSSHFLSL